jgi:Predicted Fe-S oxidoreductases
LPPQIKNQWELILTKRQLYGSMIVTYRCNAKCNMCDCFKYPTQPEEEISLEIMKRLPEMAFTNITGGEPFIRQDIKDIVRELSKKTNRIVISTNGYFSDRILELSDEFPKVGIRISIEGLPESNDAIRGLKDGFMKSYGTLTELVRRGHKDVGFGMTIQDMNAHDLIKLYKISDQLGMEFATTALHNSFYFRKSDNQIQDREKVARALEELINRLLQSSSPKKWFRAYFNHGLINYIYGNKRYLPCEMGSNGFFVDPFGDVLPCNGMTEKQSMGNLNEKTWDEVWHSRQADQVRQNVKNCPKNCWMIGSVSPAMHKRIFIPAWWVFRHKLGGSKYFLVENSFLKSKFRNENWINAQEEESVLTPDYAPFKRDEDR